MLALHQCPYWVRAMTQFDISSIPSQDWGWHPNDTDSYSPISRMYLT